MSFIKRLNVGFWICLILAVSLSCFGILVDNLPKGDDLIFHLSRIESLSEGLRLGEFPVRIYPHYFKGYGYANGLMYPDLLLYPAAFLCLNGIDVVIAYKLLLVGSSILTAAFMYYALIKITKHEWASRMGMLLYTVSLYRVVDIWTRAALGEVLAFIFIPFILLGIYYIFFEDESRWYDLTIGFSGLFLSHLLSGAIWSGVMAVICLICLPRLIKQPKRLWSLMKATMMSILLVSFFLLPMVEQLMSQKLRVSEEIAYYLGDSLLSIRDLFLTPFIKGHPRNWFPGGIGMSIIGIAILGYLAQIRSINKNYSVYSWLAFSISLFVLVMMSHLFPWYEVLKVMPIFESLQFVWRLLMVATAFLTVSFAIFYSHLDDSKIGKALAMIVLISSMVTAVSAQVATLNEVSKVDSMILAREEVSEYAVNDRNYQVGKAEYVPLKTNIESMYGLENRYRFNQEIDYEATQQGTTIVMEFKNQVQPHLKVEVPLLYYKGYRAELETTSEKVQLEVSSGYNGALHFSIPDVVGEGKVTIYYGGTTLQHLTLAISAVSFTGFIGLMIRYYRRAYRSL